MKLPNQRFIRPMSSIILLAACRAAWPVAAHGDEPPKDTAPANKEAAPTSKALEEFKQNVPIDVKQTSLGGDAIKENKPPEPPKPSTPAPSVAAPVGGHPQQAAQQPPSSHGANEGRKDAVVATADRLPAAPEAKVLTGAPVQGSGVANTPAAAPTTVSATEVVPMKPHKVEPQYSADLARRVDEKSNAMTDIKTEEDEENAEELLAALAFCAEKTPDPNVTAIFRQHSNRIHGMLTAFRDQK